MPPVGWEILIGVALVVGGLAVLALLIAGGLIAAGAAGIRRATRSFTTRGETADAPPRYVGRAKVPTPLDLAIHRAWDDYDTYRHAGRLPGERDYRTHWIGDFR